MDLWARSAIRAYAIAFFGMALLDRLWALIADPVARASFLLLPRQVEPTDDATAEMLRSQLAFDETVRAGIIFPWLEWAALLAIIGLALRLRPFDWGRDFMPYVVLVSLAVTFGRELLGTEPAFTSPFGAKLAISWLLALGISWVIRRIGQRQD